MSPHLSRAFGSRRENRLAARQLKRTRQCGRGRLDMTRWLVGGRFFGFVILGAGFKRGAGFSFPYARFRFRVRFVRNVQTIAVSLERRLCDMFRQVGYLSNAPCAACRDVVALS